MNTPTKKALELLFLPWFGEADDDDIVAAYESLDPNDRSAVICRIGPELREHYESLSLSEQQDIRVALDNAVLLGDSELDEFWGGILAPFYLPRNANHFFVWMREILEA